MTDVTTEETTGRTFETIGIVGLGTMGAGIAEVFAREGYTVVGVEQNDEGVARGRQHLENSTGRAVARQKMTEEEQAGLLGRISFSTELKALTDADFVIDQWVGPVGIDRAQDHEVQKERNGGADGAVPIDAVLVAQHRRRKYGLGKSERWRDEVKKERDVAEYDPSARCFVEREATRSAGSTLGPGLELGELEQASRERDPPAHFGAEIQVVGGSDALEEAEARRVRVPREEERILFARADADLGLRSDGALFANTPVLHEADAQDFGGLAGDRRTHTGPHRRGHSTGVPGVSRPRLNLRHGACGMKARA